MAQKACPTKCASCFGCSCNARPHHYSVGCPSTIELDPVLVNHWGILLSRTVLNFGPERYIALSEEDIAEIIRHSDPCVTFDWGYYRAFENADYPEGFISEVSIADPDYGKHLMCKQCYKDMVNE